MSVAHLNCVGFAQIVLPIEAIIYGALLNFRHQHAISPPEPFDSGYPVNIYAKPGGISVLLPLFL
jgi:hypothetical protein